MTPTATCFAWLRKGSTTRDALPRDRQFLPERLSQLSRPRALCRQVARGVQFGLRPLRRHRCRQHRRGLSTLDRLVARASPHRSAARRDLPRSGKLSDAPDCRIARTPRRKLGRTRHQFRAVLRQCEKVELCLFDTPGRRELERVELPERTEDVWHGYLNDISPGPALRLSRARPLRAERGHRFNANKLLLDPYAKRLAGRLVWSDAHFAYRTGAARGPLVRPARQRARHAQGGRRRRDLQLGRREIRPNIPWEDTIIYEAHVKGLTQKRDDVPPDLRGTYGGLSSPAMIEHLKRLGVTTVELLPIHSFIDDRILVEKKLVNYWGYNTMASSRPSRAIAQDNALDSFRTTVARLHDAGIEVMLDVVYNHTAEGNHSARRCRFRGIDNASYYWLNRENPRYYDDFTGCGSSVNLTIRACSRW